jgi:hypothetical protein
MVLATTELMAKRNNRSVFHYDMECYGYVIGTLESNGKLQYHLKLFPLDGRGDCHGAEEVWASEGDFRFSGWL